jgi:anti-sigma B factor antagonist
MDIVVDEPNPHTRCLRLSGRLDMKGTGEIEQRFTVLAAADSKHIVVDLSGVDFIASIGMRLLLSCAKAKSNRGGLLVLSAPQALVSEALEMAGIDSLIPTHADEAGALAALPG